MVDVDYGSHFKKAFSKIKDKNVKQKVSNQIVKIVHNPEIGKPMKHSRKGTREVYVKPWRLSYAWIPSEKKVVFLDLYHKDAQ